MVTKEELYQHPKVVARILEEVEKQRCEKIKDSEGIRLNLAFTWKASIEGEEIWREIHSNSNFTPFYEFWGMQDPTVKEMTKVYTIKEVIEQELVVNTKTLSEAKRLVEEFRKKGFFKLTPVEFVFSRFKEQSCFNVCTFSGEKKGFSGDLKFYTEKSTIIDSIHIVSSSEIPDAIITENNELKTQIDPNDLKECDEVWSYKLNQCKEPYKVFISIHAGNCLKLGNSIFAIPSDASFTPYNIVTGGATFDRPVQYPKEGELCFMKSDLENEITSYSPILFDSRDDQEDKNCFSNGSIITAEAYFKLVTEYNSKL